MISIRLLTLVLLAQQCVCTQYTIAWLAPTTPDSDTQASSSMGGLALAFNDITADPNLLPTDTFDVTWKNSDCDSKSAISSMYDLLVQDGLSLDVVFGPPCSDAMIPVGELSAYRDTPIFGWLSPSSSLGDKDIYNTLVRSLGPRNSIGIGLERILLNYQWRRVTLISSQEDKYANLGSNIYTTFTESANNFTLTRWTDTIPEGGASEQVITDTLKSIKGESRVVIFCIPKEEIRTWMVCAEKLSMINGEYVFIFLNQEIATGDLRDYYMSSSIWQSGDSDDNKAKKAMESLLILTVTLDGVQNMDDYFNRADEAATSNDWPNKLGVTPSASDDTSPYLHDAVLLWAHLAQEAVDDGLPGQVSNGSYLMDKARNRRFTGTEWATGDVYLDGNGDREPGFWLLDMDDNGNFILATELKHVVDGNTITRELSPVTDITWGDGTKGDSNAPKDVPTCGFNNENCPNLALYIAPPVVFVVLVVIVIIAYFAYRKYEFEQSLKDMIWKLSRTDLVSKTTKKVDGSALLRLSRTSSIRRSRHSHIMEDPMKERAKSINTETDTQDSGEGGQIFINIANYKGTTVAYKKLRKDRIKLDRELLVELKHMSSLKNASLAAFIGATVESPDILEVWEYCPKGSLQDVLMNDNIKLEDMFKFSIVVDILKGLKFLHDSQLRCHGKLKSSNCVIDGRWVCKLTDYGLFTFRDGQKQDPEMTDHHYYSQLFWTAPELLRQTTRGGSLQKSPEGDVYAWAVIMKEITTRTEAYSEIDYLDPEEIIDQLKESKSVPLRPDVSSVRSMNEKLFMLIKEAWHEKPGNRPSVGELLRKVQKINPNKSSNVVDNMISMMERYANNLEEIVNERTQQVEVEKKRSEQLLMRMLPRTIAEDLKAGRPVKPETYDSVSIYFSDIVSFTKLAAASTPMQVVDLLNDLYTIFDSTIANHDVYKVETIGDAYMYVSGLPIRNGDNHAVEVTNCAMDLLSHVSTFKVRHLEDYQLRIRIGLHTGAAVAGVVGMTMPRYCLFGDTITIASTMESGGAPMRIHMSESTYKLLSKFSGYHLAERGQMEVKGKGKIMTYFVVKRDGYKMNFPDFDALCAEDGMEVKKLPVTKGKEMREGPARPSTESGFFDTESADIALSRKTSENVDNSKLENIDEVLSDDVKVDHVKKDSEKTKTQENNKITLLVDDNIPDDPTTPKGRENADEDTSTNHEDIKSTNKVEVNSNSNIDHASPKRSSSKSPPRTTAVSKLTKGQSSPGPKKKSGKKKKKKAKRKNGKVGVREEIVIGNGDADNTVDDDSEDDDEELIRQFDN